MVIIAQPLVSAQYYEIHHTTLILNPIPRIVEQGDHIIFSGNLFTIDGKAPLTDRLVFIEYDNPHDCTRILATTTTDSNGNFSVVWKALPKGYSGGTYNLFAKYNNANEAEKHAQEMKVGMRHIQETMKK